MSLPNLISLARLLVVPLAVYFILHGLFAAAFWVFVAAGASDAVDGFLAKRLGQSSTLGAYLDPLADKALLMAVYITLGAEGNVASWLVILVVFRDLIIVGGVLLLHVSNRSVSMRPLFISKANTVAQIALIVAILGELGLAVDLGVLTEGLVYLVAATTLVSGAAYLVTWGRHVSDIEDGAQ